MEYIVSNVSTIVISALLLAQTAGIVRKMRSDRKNGRSSCGCSCGGCPSVGLCHRTSEKGENRRTHGSG